MDLTGKRVFVTGASSGIGEAAAKMFASRGAVVAICAEHDGQIRDVAESIVAAGGKATAFHVDLSHREQVDGLVTRVEEAIGPLDAIVNNAGIGLGASVLQTRDKDLRLLFEVNFFALESLCKQAFEVMSKRRSGRIVNVSSAAGLFGSPNVAAYSATKGAVHAFSQALRIEAAPFGVEVTEALPISVNTAFFDNVKGDKYRPSGIVITSEQVAESIVDAIAAKHAPAEALPYRPIRLGFVAIALAPGIVYRIAAKRYERMTRKHDVTPREEADSDDGHTDGRG